MRIILFIFCGITLLSASAPAPALGEVLKIGGTGSALGTMKILSDQFNKLYPGVRVMVLPSLGSSGALKALSKGAIDIGLCGRPLREGELKLNLSLIEYAVTPFVFVVNKEVNISGITTGEVVKKYTCEDSVWPDGERIRVILRPVKESDTIILREISYEMNEAVLLSHSLPGMQIAITDQDNADRIETIPGAFGALTLTQILAEERSGIKILSFNNVIPKPGNILNGTYPLKKHFSMVTHKNCSESVSEFINFMKSAKGREILRNNGNVVLLK